MDWYLFTVVLVSLIFSAFFSGIEIAFISADKLQIELQRKQGDLAGKILASYVQKPSEFIGTTLIGNTIALVVYGYFMALVLEPWIAGWLPAGIEGELRDISILLIQTLLSTILVLFTAEFTPKSVFLLNPNWLLSILALPFRAIHLIMKPVVWVIIGLSRWMITKVLRRPYEEDKPVFRLTDINEFVQRNVQAANSNEEENQVVDAKIFANALEFKTIRVRDCLIPRTEVVAVDLEEGIDAMKQAFIDSGHSKILVYRESIDDIVGYCHSLELFKKPKDIQQILTPIIIVPETMLANELMIQFITEHKSLALVVDEFGGTSGIVSMEDIIEEIFGDIQDEHDEEDLPEHMLGPNSYLLSARLEIDYLNEKYSWDLPDGDYDTLGGLILAEHEDIPQTHEEVVIGPYRFTVQQVDGNRINTVRLDLLSPRQEDQQ